MSNVVKAERGERLAAAQVFDMSDIEATRRRTILADARARRRRGIAEAARREADGVTKRAAEEGARRGIEEGRQEGLRLGAQEAREDAYSKAHDEIAQLTAALVKALETFAVDEGRSLRPGAIGPAETGARHREEGRRARDRARTGTSPSTT